LIKNTQPSFASDAAARLSSEVALSGPDGYMGFMMAPRTGAEGGQEMLNAPKPMIAGITGGCAKY
jgi:hypothetical protein